jgi:uncharacterized protein
MKTLLISIVCGVLFGLGLWFSGMVYPSNVIGFLDVLSRLTGQWRADLMFVMIGAIAVMMPAVYWAKRRQMTFFNTELFLPTSQVVDRRLVIGSILFGIGWGLSGICPGPALALLGAMNWHIVWFLVPMLLGIWLVQTMQKKLS